MKQSIFFKSLFHRQQKNTTNQKGIFFFKMLWFKFQYLVEYIMNMLVEFVGQTDLAFCAVFLQCSEIMA